MSQISVFLGSGGVGKTTLSAAYGLKLARLGIKTLVLTIDPAKRLKTALKLNSNGGVQDIGKFFDCPSDIFFASMPESSQIMDSFMKSLGGSTELLSNTIFRLIAQDYSGAHEFLALKHLSQIWEEQKYEHIILDTPPSRHALNFLDSPKIMQNFFEQKALKFLFKKASLTQVPIQWAFSLLEKLTGSTFIQDLRQFTELVFALSFPFQNKMEEMHALLKSSQIQYHLVTRLSGTYIEDAQLILRELHQRGLFVTKIFVNKSLLSYKVPSSVENIEYLIEEQKQQEKWIKSLSFETLVHVPEADQIFNQFEDVSYVARFL